MANQTETVEQRFVKFRAYEKQIGEQMCGNPISPDFIQGSLLTAVYGAFDREIPLATLHHMLSQIHADWQEYEGLKRAIAARRAAPKAP